MSSKETPERVRLRKQVTYDPPLLKALEKLSRQRGSNFSRTQEEILRFALSLDINFADAHEGEVQWRTAITKRKQILR